MQVLEKLMIQVTGNFSRIADASKLGDMDEWHLKINFTVEDVI